jgi:hypothetical protein
VLLDTDRRGLIVRYVSVAPIEVVRAETTVAVLDGLLRSLEPAPAAKTSI